MAPPELHLTPAGAADDAELFSSRRRRLVVAILRETDVPVALADLTRELLARERDARVSDIPHDEVRQCHVGLYHNHVPKLADAGLVEFDPDRRTVALTE